MDGLYNFLADNYLWFGGASLIFLVISIGLIIKKKKQDKNVVEDVGQQPIEQVVVDNVPTSRAVTSISNQGYYQEQDSLPPGAVPPTLDEFNGNVVTNYNTEIKPTNSFDTPTLVIEDNSSQDLSMMGGGPTLVIEDQNPQQQNNIYNATSMNQNMMNSNMYDATSTNQNMVNNNMNQNNMYGMQANTMNNINTMQQPQMQSMNMNQNGIYDMQTGTMNNMNTMQQPQMQGMNMNQGMMGNMDQSMMNPVQNNSIYEIPDPSMNQNNNQGF